MNIIIFLYFCIIFVHECVEECDIHVVAFLLFMYRICHSYNYDTVIHVTNKNNIILIKMKAYGPNSWTFIVTIIVIHYDIDINISLVYDLYRGCYMAPSVMHGITECNSFLEDDPEQQSPESQCR